MASKHYEDERKRREEIIGYIGYGETIKTVLVDRHHPNGPEIHKISDTGIITIYNAITNKLVTRLIARPGQIRRYYEDEGEKAPGWLIKKALEHQQLELNKI